MNKQEALDYEIKKHKKTLELIDALPEVEGASYIVSILSNEAFLSFPCDEVEELFQKLHDLKSQLGEYKIADYWLACEGRVMAKYYFGKTRVNFQIDTSNQDAVIHTLSNGKCKIEERVEKTVVCGVKV